jgi:nucleosome assembly protein 1-like 1
VEEHDEPLLDALEDIRVEYFADRGAGWKLSFHFADNAYFTNTVLTKTYHSETPCDWDTAIEYVKVESDAIDWKAGMNVTVELQKPKKKKSKGAAKPVEVPRASFFRTFFRNLGAGFDEPTDVEDEEDSDDDEERGMEQLLDADVEIAEALRDTILPHAVRFYTHEAGNDEDEDEDDEDEDEDEDDSEEEAPAKKSAAKKKGA